MKTLICLLIFGKLLTVTTPQNSAAPEKVGFLAQTPAYDATMVYAHSNLSGSVFYDLHQGDDVLAVYSDGSTQNFEVKIAQAHVADSQEIAATGENFNLNVGDGQMTVNDALDFYSLPGEITLVTCYSANKGFGITTGRLFVELAPIVEDQ